MIDCVRTRAKVAVATSEGEHGGVDRAAATGRPSGGNQLSPTGVGVVVNAPGQQGPLLHRPRAAGYAAGTLVAVIVIVIGLLVVAGPWAVLLVLYGAIPIVAVCAGAMGVTHLLTATVVPQFQQVLIAAGCGAVAGAAASSVGWFSFLLGALALGAGRAVAIRWTGPRPPRPSWEDRTFGR